MKWLVTLLTTAVVLALVPATTASAGVWNQGVPKPAGVECEDLNGYLFTEGSVPIHLQPIYSADATTVWSESWSGAEWAGGAICIRTVDDPSCVAQGGCPQPVAAPAPAPPSGPPSLSQLTALVYNGATYVYPLCSAGQSIATQEDLTSYPTWHGDNLGGRPFPYDSSTGVLTIGNYSGSDQIFTLNYRCY